MSAEALKLSNIILEYVRLCQIEIVTIRHSTPRSLAFSLLAFSISRFLPPHLTLFIFKFYPTISLNILHILAAETSEQADEWIAAIRAVASLYAPPPEAPGGPPKVPLFLSLFTFYLSLYLYLFPDLVTNTYLL